MKVFFFYTHHHTDARGCVYTTGSGPVKTRKLVVRGGSLGVIYLRYHGGIGSLINWSFGTFSLGG
jgi:hypothetical protein